MAKSKARNSRAKELLPYLVLSLIVISALLLVSRYTGFMLINEGTSGPVVYTSWSISLSASSTSLPAGSSTTLTATANHDVGPTEYYILIYEGSTRIRVCAFGASCKINVTKSTTGTYSYTAKVGDPYNPNGSIVKATSNTVKVTWGGASIQLKNYPTIVPTPLVVISVNGYAADVAGMGDIIASLPRTTSSVVRLSSEVGTVEKSRNLILIGGPCVNPLVADLATAGRFPYSCSNWPGENFGIIFAIKDAYTAGKNVMVVAGTRSIDTREASQILQNYATKLGAIKINCAKVITTTSYPTIAVAC